MDNKENVATLIEDMKKIMDRHNDILRAVGEEMKHATKEKK